MPPISRPRSALSRLMDSDLNPDVADRVRSRAGDHDNYDGESQLRPIATHDSRKICRPVTA
jgi:hypothetical protein